MNFSLLRRVQDHEVTFPEATRTVSVTGIICLRKDLQEEIVGINCNMLLVCSSRSTGPWFLASFGLSYSHPSCFGKKQCNGQYNL